MEAECSDDVMKLSVHFNDSFSGLIYSAGEQGKGFEAQNKSDSKIQKKTPIL